MTKTILLIAALTVGLAANSASAFGFPGMTFPHLQYPPIDTPAEPDQNGK
ncbi:hypothetical protein [Actibacterium mucosum]|nr:hypothetical protein [Actibacterium mucosum]